MIVNIVPLLGTCAKVSTQFSRLTLLSLLTFFGASQVCAQKDGSAPPPDSMWTVELPLMVVTATRTAISLRDVPVPTKVLLSEEIKKRGVLRLSDLLAEEPGMLQVHYFGAGIQLQGFDSEYTLILIDGQPVIGRNGGTLDLERFAVSDIESVEIVKGPSSSLYGSEALAGVINLRTRRASHPFSASAAYRVQTNGTRNSNISVESRGSSFGSRISYDRFSSEGFDLSPEVLGLTGPGFVIHTSSAKFDARLSDRLSVVLGARLAIQDQSNKIGFDRSGAQLSFDENLNQKDWSLTPELIWKLTSQNKLTLVGHVTSFDTRRVLSDDEGRSTDTFEQHYRKIEVQNDLILGSGLILNTGGGIISEDVRADRISGEKRANRTFYAFSQQQWFPFDRLQMITSARLDRHTNYGTRFSPKAAIMFKARGSLRVRASVGSGFKAPSFQQLYLDFTNAVAGYTVIGAADAGTALQELDEIGQIQTFLTDPNTFAKIRPESSVAFNLSTDFDVTQNVHVHVALFRNNVKDLIETIPVASKPNGQSVFSYVNLSRIYTQGLTSEIRVRSGRSLSFAIGYQYLDARDRDVLEEIDAGQVFGRRNGRDFRLTRSDYGGLYNRSRHSGTLQIAYEHERSRTSVRIRGMYRSRYGYSDRNGNLILDASNEYVGGYSIWNATVYRTMRPRMIFRGGINNIFAYTNLEFVPSFSGRQVFASLSYSIH